MHIMLRRRVEPMLVSAIHASINSERFQLWYRRLSPPILNPGPSGVGCAVGRASLRRWDGKTEQVVDVIPEKALHEQKSGLVTHIIVNHDLHIHFRRFLSFGFLRPYPIMGIVPSMFFSFLPTPETIASGIQSGSIQLPTSPSLPL